MKKFIIVFLVASLAGIANAETAPAPKTAAEQAYQTCIANKGTSAQCQTASDVYKNSNSVPITAYNLCLSNGNTPEQCTEAYNAYANAAPSSATKGFVALAPIPGLTEGATADPSGLANFLNNLYKFLIGIAAALAVIEIIWGGLEYSTQDSISKKSDGKSRIQQAILGLVLVLSPVLVFSIINPRILNLSLNLPPLKGASQVQQVQPQVYMDDELKQLFEQIEGSKERKISTPIEIPIRSGSDQEQQNVTGYCKFYTSGKKIVAAKGTKDGPLREDYYTCI